MNDFSKMVNLIWRVPIALLVGGIGYTLVKSVAIDILTVRSTLLSATEITTIGTILPLIVPIGALVWAFGEFIFPPEPPKEPPERRGGFIR